MLSVAIGPADGASIVGSAFAISDEYAVTAFHCVRGKDDSPTHIEIWLRFEPGTALRASIIHWDREADLALLRLDGPLPEGWRPIPISVPSQALEEARVRIEGFPADWTYRDQAMRIGGVLRDATANLGAGVPALGLYSEEVAGGRDPSGYSGGPVRTLLRFHSGHGWLSGWVAVGVVRWGQPIEPDAERKGRGGQVFASPLTEDWPELRGKMVIGEPIASGGGGRALEGDILQFGDQLAKANDFVGREEVLAQIRRAAIRYDCAYVHVEGAAGMGKTALAAHFARAEDAPTFFVDAHAATTRADQCLRHLTAELVVRHRLKPDESQDRVGRESAAFSAVLGEATKSHAGPVWLVIDALDEAASVLEANPLLLPPRLPPGAFVLLTSRNPATELFTDPETQVVALSLADDDENFADVRRYVTHQIKADRQLRAAVERMRSATDASDAVDRITAASEGNFQYVKYVLADLRDPDHKGDALDFDSPPPGLDGYYQVRFWQPMTAVIEKEPEVWGRLYRPVLEQLAVAAEPVPASWIAAGIAASEADVTDRVLRTWRRFLRADSHDGKEVWRIVHKSFADFLAKHLDVQAAHAACSDQLFARRANNGYASRHLTTHLRYAGRDDALLELLMDPGWEEAQLNADPSGGLYLNDLAQAWSSMRAANASAIEVGKPPARLGREVWCALATASFQSRSEAIPPELLIRLVDSGRWTIPQALATATKRLRSSNNPIGGLLALLPRLSEKQVREVEAVARRSRFRSIELLAAIAKVSPLRDQARIIDDILGWTRSETQRNRIHSLVTTLAILPPNTRPPILDEALAAAYEMGTHDEFGHLARGPALLSLVPFVDAPEAVLEDGLSAFEAGDAATNLSWIAPELDSPRFDETLITCLQESFRLSVEAEYVYLARRLPGRLVDRAARLALEAVPRLTAAAETLVSLLSRASEEVVRETLDAWRGDGSADADRIRAAAACRLADLGRAKGALGLTYHLKDPELRARALIAAIGAGDEVRPKAYAAARNLDDPQARAAALHELAIHSPESDRLLREALKATREIGSSWKRQDLLGAIAPDLPDALLDDALASARMSDDDDRVARADALLTLSQEVDGSDRDRLLTGAETIVNSIGPHMDRGAVVGRLTKALAAAGRGEAALAQLARPPQLAHDPYEPDQWRFSQLLDLASTLAEPLRSRALEMAHDSVLGGPAWSRAMNLVDLSLLYDDAQGARLAQQAENLVASLVPQAPRDRASALAAMLPVLRGERLAATVRELAELATMKDKELSLLYSIPWERMPDEAESLIGELLERLTRDAELSSWQYMVSAIADRLPESCAWAVVQWARAHAPRDMRDATLISLSGNLARQGRGEAACRAIEGVVIPDEAAVYLGDVLPYLAEPRRREVSHLILRSIGKDDNWMLEGIIPHIPVNLLSEALDVASTLTYPDGSRAAVALRRAELGDWDAATKQLEELQPTYYGEASVALIARQPHRARDEALRRAALDDANRYETPNRSKTLAVLAPALAALPPAVAYNTFTTLLPSLAQRSRADLLADLAALAPVLRTLGGQDVVLETAEAAFGVAERWG